MNQWKDRVLNAVFPRFCVRCEAEGSLLCEPCLGEWEPAQLESDADLFSLFPYADPVVRDLVCAWKYHFDQSAWEILKRKMRPRMHAVMQMALAREVQAIIPLPLHESRLCERGFDQAVVVAKMLSRETGLPIKESLYRTRTTGKQSERSTDERKQEMRDSPFLAIESVPGSVILVDDVYTTGATSAAAVEALKRAGARRVLIFTIAQG
jgi:ComF family protein